MVDIMVISYIDKGNKEKLMNTQWLFNPQKTAIKQMELFSLQ